MTLKKHETTLHILQVYRYHFPLWKKKFDVLHC